MLSSRPIHPTPAMNPFCRPTRPMLPPGNAFRPGRRLFSLKTAAPFRPGCSMNASGWLLRCSGWPMGGAGCSTARAWTQVRQPGCSISGAGWPIRHAGQFPISQREHPGAFMEDPAASMARPGSASEHPETTSGHPEVVRTVASCNVALCCIHLQSLAAQGFGDDCALRPIASSGAELHVFRPWLYKMAV